MTRAAAVPLALVAVVAAVVVGRGDDAPPAPGSAADPLVRVEVERQLRPAGGALGFRVQPGVVATVAHALAGGGAVMVRDAAGGAHAATVVERDDRTDLALLAVPGLAGDADLALDADGDPSGRAASLLLPDREAQPVGVRRAVVVRLAGAQRDGLELAAQVAAGDSGAPVIVDGRVVGVVFATSRDHPGTAWAVAAAELAALLERRE